MLSPNQFVSSGRDKATQEEGTFLIIPIGHLGDLDSYLTHILVTSPTCTPDHQILRHQYPARIHKAYPLFAASSPSQRVADCPGFEPHATACVCPDSAALST
eukprot:7447273-Ditylum_brightwellii.AAC.1